MALSRIKSESVDLADDFAFTGTVTGAGSNILEQLFINANGESVTVPSGTYTIGDVTAELLLTNSWVDIPSSDISYTPPSGATYVTYEFNYIVFGMNSHMITHHKFYIDSDEVTQARRTIQGSGGGYDIANVNWKWGIAIGGTADTASGRQSTWTTAKTLKLQARNYSASYRGSLFAMDYWDGGSLTSHTRPTMQITAYK